tara:strand:- start:1593 stop:1817 length:225 start_codon:yes stop_codon:yes gene_type:complete
MKNIKPIKKKVIWSIFNYSKSTPNFIVKVVGSIKGVLAIAMGTAFVQNSPYWSLGFALGMGVIDEIAKGFGYED